MKTVAVGCDHAGYIYKDAVKSLLNDEGFDIIDFGTDSLDSVDYPDFVHPVSSAVEEGKARFGVILCGSGNGVAMTANKHDGIRAALCWQNDIAKLARLHNDANVIAIPARFVSEFLALEMIQSFIHTPFEGGRHQRRVDKIQKQSVREWLSH
jgi:ribose 5-phosphate isomerase B